jgi:hypothetical protein
MLLLLLTATACTGEVRGGDSAATGPSTQCQSGDTESCVRDNGDVGLRACDGDQGGFAWGACAPAPCTGFEGSCTTPSGQAGDATCTGGTLRGGCGVIGDCAPTPAGYYDCETCVLTDGQWTLETSCPDSGDSSSSSSGTPLVLSFHQERVGFTRASGSFDLFGHAATIPTDWVSSATPWLARDLDGNGRIDDGGELFGSLTQLQDGTRASNGFVALAALDEDRDGQITPRDPGFADLVVWRDTNQDRQSSPDELTAVGDAGIVAIALGHRVVPHCAAGNCELERAGFVYRGPDGVERTGDVIDVHLAVR